MIPLHAPDVQAAQLPDLRFVPTESVLPHEQPDNSRLEPLVQKIRDQSVLKNPPIVTTLSGEGTPQARYVVLDVQGSRYPSASPARRRTTSRGG